ncbi:MAG TPA: PH domain-containing protein [Candidatus Limnocylindrales bacterium]|nr:PH domain-containing protein [Candidatus Limnocylindrales bacterium]
MRYADTLLADGERVVLRRRQHWLALLLEARTSVALWVLAVAAFVLGSLIGPSQRGVSDILGVVSLVALLVGLLLFLLHAWAWWAQDYLVTNRRILKVDGIINKRSADSSLEKINDAVLTQDLFGRLFGYGDLDILTAADTAIDRYHMLAQAPLFKREMLNQKHALEMEFSYRQPPSPPLRAGEAGAAAPARPASPGAAPPGAGRSGPRDANEVMATIARRAELRDKGAITTEEYEAKKDDLLGRL